MLKYLMCLMKSYKNTATLRMCIRYWPVETDWIEDYQPPQKRSKRDIYTDLQKQEILERNYICSPLFYDKLFSIYDRQYPCQLLKSL